MKITGHTIYYLNMGNRIVEMGENFTGVKNQKLTRLLGWLFAAFTLAAAAGMTLIQPPELAAELDSKTGHSTILYTGPNVLYRSKHIPGSIFGGTGSNAAGLATLREEAGKLPRNGEIVIYCGCCPWDRCPNIKPALDLLKEMGFTRVKALYLEAGFKPDWIDKGYATEPLAHK
jgi:rhodanese-related sulfurtransferase